jgi:hypothetical protein
MFKNEHVLNGQWMFHGVPRVIILMEKTLTIEVNPMNFLFNFFKKSDMCPTTSRSIFKHVSYFD